MVREELRTLASSVKDREGRYAWCITLRHQPSGKSLPAWPSESILMHVDFLSKKQHLTGIDSRTYMQL